MKKYLTITVREQMQGMTVEKVLYDYLELTKKQVSRAKFRPDGICKNKVQCRVTEKVSMGDEICICLETDEIQSAVLPAWQMQGHVRVLRQSICDSQAPTVRSYKWNPGSTFLTETAADGKVCTPCASQAVRCKMHRSVENHDLSDNSDRHF